jgi:hypothetical protein
MKKSFEKRSRNKLMILFSFVLIILSINFILAEEYYLLCLTKGQTVRFSLCNPQLQDRTCSGTCQFCVTRTASGAYCPANFNSCNLVTQDCVNLQDQNGTVTPPANTAPFEVTLSSPDDAARIVTGPIDFSYTLTNYDKATACRLLMNGRVVAMNSSAITSSTNTISRTMNPGSYTWSIRCVDKLGKTGQSSPRSLVIIRSTENPPVNPQSLNINLLNPANAFTTTINESSKELEYRFSLSSTTSLKECSLLVNNNQVQTNISKLSSLSNIIKHSLTPGTYSWNINCVSINDTIYSSAVRSLVINSNAPVPEPSPSPTSSGGGGRRRSSSGGGTNTCTTKWNCTDWSECVDNNQTRNCSYLANFCKPKSQKPSEKQNCTVEIKEETNNNKFNITQMKTEPVKEPNSVSTITGAFAYVRNDPKIWIPLVIIIIVAIIIVYIKVNNKLDSTDESESENESEQKDDKYNDPKEVKESKVKEKKK